MQRMKKSVLEKTETWNLSTLVNNRWRESVYTCMTNTRPTHGNCMLKFRNLLYSVRQSAGDESDLNCNQIWKPYDSCTTLYNHYYEVCLAGDASNPPAWKMLHSKLQLCVWMLQPAAALQVIPLLAVRSKQTLLGQTNKIYEPIILYKQDLLSWGDIINLLSQRNELWSLFDLIRMC